MFNGAFTEWFPAFGESWQMVQVPTIESGTVTPFEKVWPLRPPTPVIVIGLVLKMAWPRATAARASETP